MLFKCEHCNKESHSELWNRQTTEEFGEGSYTVESNEFDAFHVCPECNDWNLRQNMEEVK